jgi:D-alanyl-D-alanine carboxypeptidase (penicillin-binding protein 5/6)
MVAAAVSTAGAQTKPADPLDGPPIMTAKAWAIVDGTTGKQLWGADEKTPRKGASTAKIMCATVVLRLAERDPKVMDEVVTFSKRADATDGSTSGLKAGESVSVRECLYGLLLPSGNDAGVALAEHFGDRFVPPAGDTPDKDAPDARARFIAEMNRTAKELGLHEATYGSPFGDAPGEGKMTISARDLARLGSLAMQSSTFRQYVGTRRHECTARAKDGTERRVVWENTNRLLDLEGFDGVKTGYTEAAGYCLVSSSRRGAGHLIVVVLGCTSRDSRDVDSRNLVRWAWSQR